MVFPRSGCGLERPAAACETRKPQRRAEGLRQTPVLAPLDLDQPREPVDRKPADEPAADREQRGQRARHGGHGTVDEDTVEALGAAVELEAVSDAHLDTGIGAGDLEPDLRLLGERRVALDRGHAAADPRKKRRDVARARADLERALAGLGPERG